MARLAQGGPLYVPELSGDGQAVRDLEAILHPMVADLEEAFLRCQARRRCRIAVLDVPLLFEAGGWRRVDRVVVVMPL